MRHFSNLREFPFCLTRLDEEPEEWQGVEISKAKAFEWFYRVKKWEAVFTNPDGAVEPEVTIPDIMTWNYAIGEFDASTTDYSGFAPGAEERLACLTNDKVTLIGTADSGVAMVSAIGYVYIPAPVMFEGRFYMLPYKSNNDSQSKMASWTIDGIEIPSVDPPSDEFYSEVIITPKEWWPYNPNDGGGPIFDSANGDCLRQL